MPPPPDNSSDRHSKTKKLELRVEQLEFVVAHLQNTVDDLNDVILYQQRVVDGLTRQLQNAKSDIERAIHADFTSRTPSDDKPPHY